MTSKVVKNRAAQTLETQRKRRLRRRLIIGGALVVLATFLVKEVLRDWLKGLSDSIAAAQNVESQGQAQTVLLAQQLQLSLAQSQLAAALATPQKAPTISRVNLQTEVATLRQLCAQASKDVEDTSALLDKLPQRGEGARYLREKRDEIRQNLEKLQKESQKTVTTNLVPSPSWQNHVSVLLGILAVDVFELKVVLWDVDVASAAKRTKEAADKLYEFCTWLFYFLYAAGVGIALWGALLGIEVTLGE
jgi:hypothetical protein